MASAAASWACCIWRLCRWVCPLGVLPSAAGICGAGRWKLELSTPHVSILIAHPLLTPPPRPLPKTLTPPCPLLPLQERLEREYDLDLIVTAPSVVYKVNTVRGQEIIVDTPSRMPDPTLIENVTEPYVALEILSPKDYSGTLMELCQARRGEYKDLTFVTPERISLKYEIPLSEVRRPSTVNRPVTFVGLAPALE